MLPASGGGYSIFGGKEVSRALGKMAIAEEECNDKLDDLTEKELETLQKWIDKFENKYPVAGKVRGDARDMALLRLG